jgi:sugar lactone lactonase YvrE
MSLFHPSAEAPHLTRLAPDAAMPGGQVHLQGDHLGPAAHTPPTATIGDTAADVTLSRPTQATIRVPEGCISGDLILHRNGTASNALPLRVAVPMAENLHPVANPVVDPDGNVYATVSGPRGQAVPVSIFRIQRDFQITPFVRDLLNATGLAFDPAGYLYASSRAEGAVYRISPEGSITTYAEGLGIATGLAFDRDGNLFVGDRSGTIFKIAPGSGSAPADPDQIFVYATLEPSIAAYHLAFNDEGTLFVTGPTTSSNQAIHAIDRDGNATVFYQGLGRAQGMAFDHAGNLYVAASLQGQRGIVRITPAAEATLAVSGNNLVGLAFLEDGCATLATRDALYHIDLGIEGRPLL